jgi:uncharacterized membrane protein YccC
MTSSWTGLARRRARKALNRAIADDPGLARWHLAWRTTVAVAIVAVLEYWIGPLLGLRPIAAMMLGGVVAMNGSFLLAARTRLDASLTATAVPFIAFGGVAVAVAAGHYPQASRLGFVVLTVLAVYIRRFGNRGLNYGLLGWFCYLFGTFSHVTWDQLVPIGVVFLLATAGLVVLMVGVAYERPEATVAAALRGFDLRVAAVARACAELIADPVPKAERDLQARGLHVLEAALIVEGHLASSLAPANGQAHRIRTRLLSTELAVDEVTAAATALAGSGPLPVGVMSSAAAALRAAAHLDLDQARRYADELAKQPGGLADELSIAGLAHAVRDLSDALAAGDDDSGPHPAGGRDPGSEAKEFEPGVHLIVGYLPGAATSAADALEAGGDARRRWLHPSLNTRQCVQAGLASLLTLVCAVQISPGRYYWAMLACLFVLTGTATTGETLVKGTHRLLGTALGVVAAIAAVHLTRGHDALIIAVMSVCVFVGVYFFRVAYAVLAFAVTTLMGLLYDALGLFSDALLVTRLLETAIGAVVAALVAVLVFPVHNRRAIAAARGTFVVELVALLEAVRDKSAGQPCTPDLLMSARRLDARMHQLALAAHPWGGPTLARLDGAGVARKLRTYTKITVRARALAAAAALHHPCPDVAAKLTAPLRRLTGDYGLTLDLPERPWPVLAATTGPERGGVRTRTLTALADDLAAALSSLHPSHSALRLRRKAGTGPQ